MSEKKKDIINHMFTYLPSRYFSQGVGFFTSLFMKRFLGPFSAGIWDLLKVIISYVDYAELGSTNAIYYKVPIYLGQGKKEEAEKVKNVVFGFVMLCSFIAASGIMLYALVFSNGISRELFWGLLTCSALVIIERIYTFYVTLMRAHKDYTALSKSIYFDAVVNLLLVVTLVYWFKLYGLYLAIVILTALNIVYIRRNVAYPLKFTIRIKETIEFIKFGFPVYLTSILTVLLNTVDRVMIAHFLGFQQLGYYSIAMMSKNYSHQLSTNFSHVTSPHFLEDFGKFGNSPRIYQYLTKGSFSLSCFMSVVLGFIFIFSVPLISAVLPQFAQGIPALKIFLLTSLFVSLSTFPVNYIVTQEKQKNLVLFAAISLAVNVSFNYFFIKSGFGIEGVALATAISSFVYLAVIMVYAMRSFCNAKQILTYAFKIFLPAVYVASLLFMLEAAVIAQGLVFNAVIKALLFLAGNMVLMLLLEKETGLVSLFFSMLKKRIFKNAL